MRTLSSRRFRVSAAAAALALTLAACGGDDGDAAEQPSATTAAATSETTAAATETSEAMSEEAGTIVDVATEAGTFTTLVAAVTAADLGGTLSGEGPYTVFAPTDEAFAAALKSLNLTPEQLLADKEKLTQILTYHVVAGDVTSKNLLEMKATKMGDFEVKSLEGDAIDVKFSGNSVMVDGATVIMADVKASNGVIHAIDTVIMPGS